MRGFFKALLGIENRVEATPLPIKTPDITHGQVYAGLQFAVSVAVGAAVLSPAEGQVLIGASGVIGVGIALGDAVIRHGRATAIGQKILASVQGGGHHMGSGAPQGEALPPLPPAEEPPVEEKPPTAFERVEGARTAPQEPPAPAVPPEHIAEAQAAVQAAEGAAQAARDRLTAMQKSAATSQPPQ